MQSATWRIWAFRQSIYTKSSRLMTSSDQMQIEPNDCQTESESPMIPLQLHIGGVVISPTYVQIYTDCSQLKECPNYMWNTISEAVLKQLFTALMSLFSHVQLACRIGFLERCVMLSAFINTQTKKKSDKGCSVIFPFFHYKGKPFALSCMDQCF